MKQAPSRYHLLKPFLLPPVLIFIYLAQLFLLCMLFPQWHSALIHKSNDPIVIITAVSILFPSIGLSLLTLNTVFFLIPPIRKTFEAEAEKGIVSKKIVNRPHKNYKSSQRELLFFTLRYLAPIGYGIFILGYIFL